MSQYYETIFREWLESIKSFKSQEKLFQVIFQELLEKVGVEPKTNFTNNIPSSISLDLTEKELLLGRRVVELVSWNATLMVLKANLLNPSIGGHLSTYLSASFLYEVGLNHFFNSDDLVFFQGHSSTGIYARAMLEGRLTSEQLKNFRRESRGGLPSYPHPRSMPDFWQFPSVSMGLAPITATHHARFMKYLLLKKLIKKERRVICFVGDGEMDEPESTASLRFAAKERLNNLLFVVNCNGIRLDLPIDESGNSICSMADLFKSSGWNVVKLIWSEGWERSLEEHVDRYRHINTANGLNDSEYLSLLRSDRQKLYELFDKKLLESIPEREQKYSHGGLSYENVYKAYAYALKLSKEEDRPVVILARTVKGYPISNVEGRTVSHQKKSLNHKQLALLRDFLKIPVSDASLEDLRTLDFYRESNVTQYMKKSRERLGGFLPNVSRTPPKEEEEIDFLSMIEPNKFYDENREISTTVATVRLLSHLKRNVKLSKRVVAIVPDEGYTFGMESLFNRYGIFSNAKDIKNRFEGPSTPLSFGRSNTGEFFNDGINEDGAVANMISIGGAKRTYGVNMVPFYFFYSIFGFQRSGDLFWAMSDQMANGFAIATLSGGTSFPGEGLQHVDSNSQLLADMNPACYSYDPAFMYELAYIIRYGLKKMYVNNEPIFFHINTYNEPTLHRKPDEGLDTDKLTKGMYLFRTMGDFSTDGVNIFASGSAVYRAIKTQEILANEYGISSRVWSVTSWSLLYRETLKKGTESLFVQSFLSSRLPSLCILDFNPTLADRLRYWIDCDSAVMAVSGFGSSDTREGLREKHGVAVQDLVNNALKLLKR
jgi:pyruvate dehydrogenase E1 component